MSPPKVLVLAGDGLNCERETAQAFTAVGAKAEMATLNYIAENPLRYKDFQIFAFPGGFSFGDELRSGCLLALKIKYLLHELLDIIVNGDKLAIGICNGFQTLTQLGIIPDRKTPRTTALTFNTQIDGKRSPFINRWVSLETAPSHCVWTRHLDSELMLPIRHGEGRVKFSEGKEKKIFEDLRSEGQIPLFYKEDVNGSYGKIAGLCDRSGRLFGLMPHPEAAIEMMLHPKATRGNISQKGPGMKFFKNAVQYFMD